MSFDRPDYLAKVLGSLRAQLGFDIDKRTVVMFQDGAISRFTGKLLAKEDAIQHCIATFHQVFPKGIVMESSGNLGVALNFERAERFGFEELNAESAIFLEDDLVLAPHYIATVDGLVRRFLHDERVGYVAAYGDHAKSIDEQRANKHRLVLLGHNWGFALFKRQWLKMRGRILEYLDVIKDCDYKDRDGDKIKKLFASWGYGDPAISQDAAKTIACSEGGAVKINTYVCNASYIGARGLHMNERIFAERGYARTAIYPELVSEFEPLDDNLFNRLLTEQRDWAKSSRIAYTELKKTSNGRGSQTSKVAPTVDEVASRKTLARDLVTTMYRALLRRQPDADGLGSYCRIFDESPLPEAVQKTINGITKSAEYAEKWVGEHGRMPDALLLSLQRGLLNHVPSSLRGVACGWTDKTIDLRFIVDGPIDDATSESMKMATTHVARDFASGLTVGSEFMRLDYPKDRHAHALQAWAYLRQEN